MKNTGLALLAVIALASCQKKEEKTETVTTEETTVTAPATEAVAEKECYRKVIAKDSIVVEIEHNGDSIHGIYHWKPYEKDKKISTYKGVTNGNTANVVAQSQQEGMNYKEEVIFAVTGNTLAVKFGEMKEDKGIWKYKDTSKTSEQVLDKVDCN
ncbi:hypothetical protein OGH69_17685 [Flavobacterium sp. MFBS3-15]|uniref:hypothetical protein n=1 Tax=Flavobacterium sp. MFBS3-15 TaxID=2989816 RepID=UPI002235768C|nr:hypothetical protein [Flavobacterium sp. MFBS3-15]MCW4470808.1 hypothetical protein [Flavobacterium sp. MFBS3-15]